MSVGTPDYVNINHNNDTMHAQDIVNKIQKHLNADLTDDTLQQILNSNMAELSDMLRSISAGLSNYHISSKTNFFTSLFALFSCGLSQTLTPQGTHLVHLVIACSDALTDQLNKLNEMVCAPVKRIEPLRMQRR